jgi:hypothetical protein
MVSEIEIVEETKQCYKDFPIKLQINNETRTAFLSNEKVIKTTSKLVDCKNNYVNIIIGSRVLVKENNKQYLDDNKKYKILNFNLLQTNITTINFQHDNRIITSVKLIEKIANLSSIQEAHGDFNIIQNVNTEIHDRINVLWSSIKQQKENHNILIFTSVCISLIVIIISSIIFRACCAMQAATRIIV